MGCGEAATQQTATLEMSAEHPQLLEFSRKMLSKVTKFLINYKANAIDHRSTQVVTLLPLIQLEQVKEKFKPTKQAGELDAW